MCARWNNSYDPDIIIKDLKKIRETGSDGTVSLDIFLFDDLLSIIFSSIYFEHDLTQEDRYQIIDESIKETLKHAKQSAKALIAKISKKENKIAEIKPKSYVLVTNLSFKYFDSLRKILIDDATIKFTEHFPNNYVRKLRDEARQSITTVHHPLFYTWVQVHIKARTISESFSRGISALNLLRALWNFPLNHSLYHSKTFGRNTEPINRILTGPIHTLHNKDGSLATDMWWYDLEYIKPVNPMNLEVEWNKVKKFEEYYRKNQTKTHYSQHIVDSLQIYVQALDERNMHTCFLKLWGALEKLTGIKEGGTVKNLIRRTSFFFKDAKFHSQVLNHLKDYRNRAVHHSENSKEIRTIVFQLKAYIEAVLNYTINLSSDFAGIEEFFQFADTSSEILEIEKQMKRLKLAKNFRKS